MSIIAILVGVSISALGSSRSTSLVAGGNLVSNLAALAQQNAVSQNTLTALVVLGGQGTADDYRSIAVIKYQAGVGWSQVTKWEVLPPGIMVDSSNTTACTFLANSPQPFPFNNSQSYLPVPYQGKQVTKYAARIFLPNGGLQNPAQPAKIRLVAGFLQSNSVVYTQPASGGTANYYDVAILGTTGAVKIIRP